MASFLQTHNLSFYTIPAAWVLAMAPHAYAMSLAGKKFDARNPRALNSSLEKDQSVDSATKARIARAEGAQANAFETIGLYAAAIVAGNTSLLPISTLNAFSLGYLATRVVYNFIYVNNTTPALASARTVVWLSGIACSLGLFIKSGNALIGRGVVV